MSTIKSSAEHLTLNADGASKDIKFQANGVEKASISSAGAFTSTTIDATKLTGTIPNFTSTGIDDNADATAITIDSRENVGIGVVPESDWYNGGVGSEYRMLQMGTGAVVGGYADNSTYLGSNWKDDAANKYINTDEASLYKQQAGVHKFMVAPSGSADSAMTLTTALEIDNSGNWVRGTASAGNSFFKVTNNATQSHCNTGSTVTTDQGHFYFTNPNGNVGSIRTSGSATSYNTSSDHRLKENVVDMENATDRVKQLKPKRFNFIADDTNTLVDGFIAHEVSSVVPEAISGAKDAMKDEEYEVTPAVMDGDTVVTPAVMGTRSVADMQGIDQSKLVPLLVKTIQELEARITALEA